MSAPETVEAIIQTYDSLGRGVSVLEDGSIVIIPNAKLGQKVKAKVKFSLIVEGRRVLICEPV